MFYLGIGVLGLVLISLSAGYFLGKKDTLSWLVDKYNVHYSTSEMNLNFMGQSLNLVVNKQDKISAWKIYNQINTRIAVVEFNKDYDSVFLVNKSLYELFGKIRDEIENIPIEKIKRDRGLANFYHNILNEGIRPYLSKWHIPISHYIESNKDSKKSILELEKEFKDREQVLKDLGDLNKRMKEFSDKLLEIIKSE